MKQVQITKIRKAMDTAVESKDSFVAEPGMLNEDLVRYISKDKNEPDWMLQKRLKGLEYFNKTGMPKWGPDLSKLDMSKIHFYRTPDTEQTADWEKVPENIKNTFDALGIPEAEQKSLAGAGAQFECLSEDSLIFTNPKGPVKIKDTKPGDFVFAFDEKDNKIKKARILRRVEKGKNMVYEVVVANKKVKATSNHPFLALSYKKKEGDIQGKYTREWKSLKDLKEGDLVAVAKKYPYKGKAYELLTPSTKGDAKVTNQAGVSFNIDKSESCNKAVFPKLTSEDLMWFFGLYIGEGDIKREKGTDKKRVNIAIPETDVELRNALKLIVKKNFGHSVTSEHKNYISLNSTLIADFIELNGFAGNPHTKKLPGWIHSISKEEKLALLAGYVDSNGHSTSKKRSYNLILRSCNRELVEDFRTLCNYCDLYPSNIYLVKSKQSIDKDEIMIAHQIEVSGDLGKIQCKHPMKASRLKTKEHENKYRSNHNTYLKKHTSDYFGFAKIKSIAQAGIQKVYDIEVEGFHNFVSDGIIVHNSSVVYHKLKKEFEDMGVIFEDMDVAVQKYPELVKKYFMTSCIPINDHKFIMLHAAVWSGGTFIYIPKGVKVKQPLQAYFRMNAKRGGQFEHTLIIAEQDSELSYLEGCSAPQFGEAKALHAGGVEIHVGKGARVRYSSVENWSTSTFNLNTKRAVVDKNGIIEWINGNMGCLPEEAAIYTDKGIKRMKDIDATESVWALDTRTRKLVKRRVLAKIGTGTKEVYELQVAGRRIKASADHPFLVLNHEEVKQNKVKGIFVYNWKPLSSIKPGDLIAIPKSIPIEGAAYKLPEVDVASRVIANSNQYGASYLISSAYKYKSVTIPQYSSNDFMWLMGFYLGYGSIWTIGNQAKVTFAIPSWSPLRDVVKDLVSNLFGYQICKEREYAIMINTSIISKLITKLGFSGAANEKRIPSWVFSLPIEQRLSLIGGVVDSDGHIDAGGAYVTSCSKDLLEDLQLLAISCGIGSSSIFNHKNSGDSYRLLMNGRKIKNIPLKEHSKKSKLDKVKSFVRYSSSDNLNFDSKTNDELGFAKVRYIKYVGKQPVFDIEVEDAHNFIANGILVHNSCVTMLYPCSILKGQGSRSDNLGIAYAGKGQNQDTGTKVYHLAPNTSSNIRMKSISKDGGITTYRGLVKVAKGAKNTKVAAVCDALILDKESISNTIPNMDIGEESVEIAHEATVGRLSKEKIFYMMSRGLKEDDAIQMIVSGFIEPIIKELPLEYAVELNKLIQLEMVGAVG